VLTFVKLKNSSLGQADADHQRDEVAMKTAEKPAPALRNAAGKLPESRIGSLFGVSLVVVNVSVVVCGVVELLVSVVV